MGYVCAPLNPLKRKHGLHNRVFRKRGFLEALVLVSEAGLSNNFGFLCFIAAVLRLEIKGVLKSHFILGMGAAPVSCRDSRKFIDILI